jgi:transcriptional activator of cad operon
MAQTAPAKLRVGDWCVDPASGQISRNGEAIRVEERTMRLLLCLAASEGKFVSIDDLLQQVWPDVTVTPDSVYQAVTSLRRLLGDDAKQPAYVATAPRLGYRVVAKVSPWQDSPVAQKELLNASQTQNPEHAVTDRNSNYSRFRVSLALSLAAVLIVVAVVFVQSKLAGKIQFSLFKTPPTSQSVAVLPFLDLTEGMHEETFADGMTEELIDKLSQAPGLRVPVATASFYFKGKQVPLGDIAKTLGVAYVLDGSVRKSGSKVRVAARLTRADNGYVIWTESYDRPFGDIIRVQDEIAGEVTKALKASIGAKPEP